MNAGIKALVMSAFIFVIVSGRVQADFLAPMVTEIMYDPEGSDTGHSDWLEFFNPQKEKVILTKENFGLIDETSLVLGKDGIHYLNCHAIKENLEIPADEFLILADDVQDFKNDYQNFAGIIVDGAFDLSSSGDKIWLSNDRCATFFAEISFESSWGGKNNGKTLELIKYNFDYNQKNWQQSFAKKGTPGASTSVKITFPQNIFINELFPRPSKESGLVEFVELFNATKEDMQLEDWMLVDRGGNKCELVGKKIPKEGFLILKNNAEEKCSLALNDTGEEILELKNPNGETVSSVSYGSAKENLSYSFDGEKWHWTSFITDGAENQFENVVEGDIKHDKGIFAGVYADFFIGGLSKKAKVTWNFGDGHKSYLAKTRHKYLETGKYHVSVKYAAGSEDVLKEFDVEVQDLPHPKVRITEIAANPMGSDTAAEYLVIANKSKKKINLLTWSIATGWKKKMVNHPINEEFVIKKGQSAKITSKISSFTLNNTKAKIQLRYPDGKVAHEIVYKKPEGIKDDEKRVKVKGGWIWQGGEKNESYQSSVIGQQNTTDSIQQTSSEKNNLPSTINQQSSGGSRLMTDNHEEIKNDDIPTKKVENKFVELKNEELKIELLKAEPKVLGVAIVREENGQYFFTPKTKEEDHYAVIYWKKFMESFNEKINSLMNLF